MAMSQASKVLQVVVGVDIWPVDNSGGSADSNAAAAGAALRCEFEALLSLSSVGRVAALAALASLWLGLLWCSWSWYFFEWRCCRLQSAVASSGQQQRQRRPQRASSAAHTKQTHFFSLQLRRRVALLCALLVLPPPPPRPPLLLARPVCAAEQPVQDFRASLHGESAQARVQRGPSARYIPQSLGGPRAGLGPVQTSAVSSQPSSS